MTAVAETTTKKASGAKLTLPLSRLQKALATVVPAVERRTTIPVLSSVRVEQTDTALEFVTTDLDVAVRARIFTPSSTNAKPFLLPALKTEAYARLLDGKDVSIECDNNRATLRCGRANTKLPLQDVVAFPKLEFGDGFTGNAVDQDTFERILRFVTFAVSNEESRYTMRGALMVTTLDKLTLVTTDGHRLAKYTVPGCYGEEMRVLLPLALLNLLAKTLNGGEKPLLLDNAAESIFATVKDASGEVAISSRKLTGSFPNYEAVMPKTMAATVKVDATQAASAIKRCLTFSDDHSGAVRLTIGESDIKLRSASAEHGETDETLDVTSASTADKFEPFVIGFNGHYLLDAFSRLSGEVDLRFSATNGSNAMMIVACPKEGELFEYVVMPMNLK